MTQAEALAWATNKIQPDPLDPATVALTTEWIVPPLSGLIDQRWREAFAAGKFAEALAWLCFEQPIHNLEPLTRGQLRTFAEELVENAVKDFAKPAVKLDSMRSFQQGDGFRDTDFDGLTADDVEARR